MNRNSLENFRDHVKNLKIPADIAAKVEEMMEKNLSKIEVTSQLPSRKGYIEATLHLKRSEQSDYYFLNKYDLNYVKAKPLEEGKQYLIISEGENGKAQFKKFDSPIQAIENFKKREGDAELAIGKSVKDKMSVATKKEGKVDYVSKEFQGTYYSDPLKNTIYINEGKAFNMKQASNMLLGGSTYRSDLVSRTGDPYKAWNVYQFDKPRDRYGNLQIKQYSEGYGFDLLKELQGYKIKELDNPVKLEQIMTDMKDGERPVVTVTNQKGEDMPMMVRPMPRYGNINFYHPNGQSEKREEFYKENRAEIAQGNIFSKKIDQHKSESQGLGV